MSQLDLAHSAEVSSRHLSFLETGRSHPSIEMVLLLAETLDVPLRDRNELLRAAGFDGRYAEPTIEDALDGVLGTALSTMLEHHEPFPLVVVDRLYRIVRTNRAAFRLFALGGFRLDGSELNLLDAMFDPAARERIVNWSDAASTALRRLQREVFHRPQDAELQSLLDRLITTPGVPEAWRQPDLDTPDEPMLALDLELGGETLSFLTTITAFNAPRNVTLDELRIESWFPLDDATGAACHRLLADDADDALDE